MKPLSFRFFSSLRAKTLMAFGLLGVVLFLLGFAAFTYQQSLFDPRRFNAQLINRTWLAVSTLDRASKAQEHRVNRILSSSELLILPAETEVRLAAFWRKAGIQIKGALHELDEENDVEDELHSFESRSLKRFAENLKFEIRRRDREQTRRRSSGRSDHTKQSNKRKMSINFLHLEEEEVDTLMHIIRPGRIGNIRGPRPPRLQDRDQRWPRFDYEDQPPPFFKRRANQRAYHLAQALERPLVLLSFKTQQGALRRMLLVPAFTNNAFFGFIAFLFVLVFLMATGLAVYAIRRVTKPLRHMERSANQFGQSLSPEPVQERGSTEIRGTIEAFNGMQIQVRNLVDQRTRIVGAVSHDLRTHLTRIRLRMQMLEDMGESDENMATAASPVTKHAKATISDLEDMEKILMASLEYTRFATGEPGTSDEEKSDVDMRFGDLARHICDAFLPKVPCTLATDIESISLIEDLGMAPTALKRALNNLLANAQRHGKEPSFHAHLSKPAQSLRVLIQDKGPGIPPDLRAQVLEPFYRLEASRNRSNGGTGLGLSIAFEIITKAGGSLQLLDRPDQQPGLCVQIILPLND